MRNLKAYISSAVLVPILFVLLTGTLSLLFTGCQIAPKPTQITETRVRPFTALVEKAERPIEVTPLTVVLDARSSFDYGLNHVVNSLPLQWSDLAEKEATGETLRDLHKAALRLSLLGLTPQTSVVIVGYGNAGRGEEGRLAWSLLFLGFHDVQITGVEAMRKSMTQEASPAAQNVPPWKAESRDELQIGKNEFLNLALNPKLRLENRVHILDVRSAQEYLNKIPGKSKLPDINAINIEWKNFFTASGRPDVKFKGKLAALGVQPEDRVILVSNRGVRSGAAAYALFALGFEHVQNFTAGWNSLAP